jgi:hypothetical protein
VSAAQAREGQAWDEIKISMRWFPLSFHPEAEAWATIRLAHTTLVLGLNSAMERTGTEVLKSRWTDYNINVAELIVGKPCDAKFKWKYFPRKERHKPHGKVTTFPDLARRCFHPFFWAVMQGSRVAGRHQTVSLPWSDLFIIILSDFIGRQVCVFRRPSTRAFWLPMSSQATV